MACLGACGIFAVNDFEFCCYKLHRAASRFAGGFGANAEINSAFSSKFPSGSENTEIMVSFRGYLRRDSRGVISCRVSIVHCTGTNGLCIIHIAKEPRCQSAFYLEVPLLPINGTAAGYTQGIY